MIKIAYIAHRNGTVRIVDYQMQDASDSDAVRTMFAKHPPVNSIDWQIDSNNEILFDHAPTPQEVTTAFLTHATI